MEPTIAHFHFANAMIIRWPLSTRRILNHSRSSSFLTAEEDKTPPFHTWAQPRYLERRKQAVAVWYNLLHFLVLNWSGYGGKNDLLHPLGLDPSRQCCDIIDDLRLYATIQARFKPPSKVVAELVEQFFLLAIRDPAPTPRTNPLLWWIAVIIHSEVNECQPRLPTPDLEDKLDFSAKLEALDHYARVLVFHNTFIQWTTPPSIFQSVPTWKHEVPHWVDGVNITWVDQNREAPTVHAEPDLTSRGWMDFRDTLQDSVDTWLVGDTKGPMREIISLQNCTLPFPRRPSNPLPPDAECYFIVSFNAVQDWSREPKVLSARYPATTETRYQSLHDANYAALEVFSKTLQNEIEEERDELDLDELDEIFPVGEDNHMTGQHDRAEGADGTWRVRGIYVNHMENVKVTAWVQREHDRMDP